MLLLFSLGICSAFAGPFDRVPHGDEAYLNCEFLAECGIIDARPVGDFAGETSLTRYDFTLSLVRPVAALEALAREGRVGPALECVERMSQRERARVGETLVELLQEFGDVLSFLGKDASQAVLGARLLVNGEYASRAGPPETDNAAGISYEGERTRFDVLYRATEGEDATLPHVPLGGIADAPITGLAATRLPAGRANVDVAAPERIASTNVSLRRLRGTVEYGLTDDLTLNLAYESMVREGRGTVVLDAASLRTLGVRYRLSPSTSVKLKYHLIDYADHTRVGSRLEDRMAETELTVRF